MPCIAVAQSIVINDCQGFTRAVKQADPGQPSDVKVQVSSASGQSADGATVQLTNVISGEVITVKTVNGIATFTGLSAGVYSLSFTEDGLTVGTIWIGAGASSALLAGGAAVVAGGAAAGGVAGVAIAVNNATSGGGNGAATPTPLPTNRPQPTATPAVHPTSRPTATPCPVCDPGSEPTPLPDFFKGQQTPVPQASEARVLSPYR